MDRVRMAREHRRRQALDGLEFERQREQALVEQLAEIVTDEEGAGVDEEAFAKMDAEDVELVRETLAGPSLEEDELAETFLLYEPDEEDGAGNEEEMARLESEIAQCRRRQRAFERYLEALGG